MGLKTTIQIRKEKKYKYSNDVYVKNKFNRKFPNNNRNSFDLKIINEN